MKKLLPVLLSLSSFSLLAGEPNPIAHFDHEKPTFTYTSAELWEDIHWQISETPDFSDVNPKLDSVESYSPQIEISDTAETFLYPGNTYFFRAQGQFQNASSDWSQTTTFSVEKPAAQKYLRPPSVSENTWNLLQDYFLPENHPIRHTLDKIFQSHHVLSSRNTFKKAGFDLLKHPQNRMIIAKHSKLKGYLVKAFLDSEPNTEWEWWKKRIDGSRVIQASIDQHGYQALMKVPKKWIYPIPARKDSGINPDSEKQFVLIVEDMHLQKSGEIRQSFKTKMTRQLLDALYVIISENLLIDSIFADNIPFSKDGRIAFVDTEHFNDTTQPVRLWMLARYLSPEMHAYWDQVLFHGRPLTL